MINNNGNINDNTIPKIPKKRGRKKKIDLMKLNEAATTTGEEELKSQWVQCDTCNKWRKLPGNIDLTTLPEAWECSMNRWDSLHSHCNDEEEKDEDEEQQHSLTQQEVDEREDYDHDDEAMSTKEKNFDNDDDNDYADDDYIDNNHVHNRKKKMKEKRDEKKPLQAETSSSSSSSQLHSHLNHRFKNMPQNPMIVKTTTTSKRKKNSGDDNDSDASFDVEEARDDASDSDAIGSDDSEDDEEEEEEDDDSDEDDEDDDSDDQNQTRYHHPQSKPSSLPLSSSSTTAIPAIITTNTTSTPASSSSSSSSLSFFLNSKDVHLSWPGLPNEYLVTKERVEFFDLLAAYLFQGTGTHYTYPRMKGRLVDLYLLFSVVEELQFDPKQLITIESWHPVALRMYSTTEEYVCNRLRHFYQKYLQNFKYEPHIWKDHLKLSTELIPVAPVRFSTKTGHPESQLLPFKSKRSSTVTSIPALSSSSSLSRIHQLPSSSSSPTLKRKLSTWTDQEDQALHSALQTIGPHWTAILTDQYFGPLLSTHTTTELRHRWRSLSNPSKKKYRSHIQQLIHESLTELGLLYPMRTKDEASADQQQPQQQKTTTDSTSILSKLKKNRFSLARDSHHPYKILPNTYFYQRTFPSTPFEMSLQRKPESLLSKKQHETDDKNHDSDVEEEGDTEENLRLLASQFTDEEGEALRYYLQNRNAFISLTPTITIPFTALKQHLTQFIGASEKEALITCYKIATIENDDEKRNLLSTFFETLFENDKVRNLFLPLISLTSTQSIRKHRHFAFSSLITDAQQLYQQQQQKQQLLQQQQLQIQQQKQQLQQQQQQQLLLQQPLQFHPTIVQQPTQAFVAISPSSHSPIIQAHAAPASVVAAVATPYTYTAQPVINAASQVPNIIPALPTIASIAVVPTNGTSVDFSRRASVPFKGNKPRRNVYFTKRKRTAFQNAIEVVKQKIARGEIMVDPNATESIDDSTTASPETQEIISMYPTSRVVDDIPIGVRWSEVFSLINVADILDKSGTKKPGEGSDSGEEV